MQKLPARSTSQIAKVMRPALGVEGDAPCHEAKLYSVGGVIISSDGVMHRCGCLRRECHLARVLIRRNQVGDKGPDVLDGALVVCQWTNK
jgi:hypothetical protein